MPWSSASNAPQISTAEPRASSRIRSTTAAARVMANWLDDQLGQHFGVAARAAQLGDDEAARGFACRLAMRRPVREVEDQRGEGLAITRDEAAALACDLIGFA